MKKLLDNFEHYSQELAFIPVYICWYAGMIGIAIRLFKFITGL
jgi:hypothetical protein